jgi:hypothetical protein
MGSRKRCIHAFTEDNTNLLQAHARTPDALRQTERPATSPAPVLRPLGDAPLSYTWVCSVLRKRRRRTAEAVAAGGDPAARGPRAVFSAWCLVRSVYLVLSARSAWCLGPDFGLGFMPLGPCVSLGVLRHHAPRTAPSAVVEVVGTLGTATGGLRICRWC